MGRQKDETMRRDQAAYDAAREDDRRCPYCEVEKEQESTRPTRAFMLIADIFETEEALTIARRGKDRLRKI